MCSRANWARRGGWCGWRAAKASKAARSTCWAPCCTRPPAASPMPTRSVAPAAKAAPKPPHATLARELGLDVAHLQPIGWSATSVPDPTAARYAELLAELARGAGAVAPGRAGRPGRTGPLPQRPGLLRRLWSANPGGPLAAGSGPDPVWRLRPALRARGRRARLTRTSLFHKGRCGITSRDLLQLGSFLSIG
jgi:hypothetical protein